MSEPNFAVYALLFLGAFVAAGISGAAGFGGALLLLPLLTYAVGPLLAVPLLTVAQLVGNLSRVALGFQEIRWRYVALFLGGALPTSALGALGFTALPAALVTRLIGAAILGFTLLRLAGKLRLEPSRALLLGGGAAVGLLSGLVGSAGPLGAAIFLSLGLPPVAYIASEASTAVAMHLTKTVVYGRSLAIGEESWALALLLGGAMVAGTYAAKRIILGLSEAAFRRWVSVLLIVVALQMLIFG